MPYEIKDVEDKFSVIEKFAHPAVDPLILETCDTREEAEEAIKQWEARDKLENEICDFVSEKVDEFTRILERSEILQMIREAASP